MAYPTSLDNFTPLVDNVDAAQAQNCNELQTAIESIEAKIGIDSSAVATSIDYLLKSASSVDVGHLHSKLEYLAASGNKIWAYANVAFTGWTIEAVTDAVLAVKGGSQAYNVTGGQTAGSWTQPDHAITVQEMPAHSHPTTMLEGGENTGSYPERGSGNVSSYSTSGTTGQGDAHSHGTTYRPLACVGIVIEKS